MITAERVNFATHGQIGKENIFWVVAGRQFKRPYKIPYDPKTFKQRTQRNKFYVASQMWGKLTTEQKEEWEQKVLKTKYVMTAYNFFIRKKMKEIKQMVKRIIRGVVLLSDGLNVISIPEIDLEKSVLLYNSFLTGGTDSTTPQYGIPFATIYNSTTIRVMCKDPTPNNDIRVFYQVIEYV